MDGLNLKAFDFINKKQEVVEQFLAEKLACTSLKDVPKRCLRKNYEDGEEYLIDGKVVIQAGIVSVGNTAAFRFVCPGSIEDKKLIEKILKEVYGEKIVYDLNAVNKIPHLRSIEGGKK